MNDTYSINMQKKEVNPGFTNVKHPNLKIQNEFLTKVKKNKKKKILKDKQRLSLEHFLFLFPFIQKSRTLLALMQNENQQMQFR